MAFSWNFMEKYIWSLNNGDKAEIRKIAEEWFDRIKEVTDMIIEGKVGIY
mgnify:CR=1 FL=1